VELHHLTEYLSAKLRVYFLTSPKHALQQQHLAVRQYSHEDDPSMMSSPSFRDTIGMLGPIELAEFRDYLPGSAAEMTAPKGLGGTPVNLLCTELLKRGHRLVIFSLDPSVDTERMFEGERLRVYFGPYTRNRAHNFYKRERQSLVRMIRREKLAFLHAQWTYEFALAAVDSGLPHVITAHDAPLNCLRYNWGPFRGASPISSYYRGARNTAFWLARTLMAYKATRSAQRVVAVSPHVADHLRRFGFHDKPIKVIPNGMPRTHFERRRERQAGSPFTFATILVGWGGLKNGAAAIEAFGKLRKIRPDLKMLMFGEGHSINGPAALWARERGWHDGIEFKGQIPYADLIDHLSRRVDVLVHPALEEAQSMALIEAMSLGIPVIGGRAAGAVPWTLGDGRYGILIDVRSADQIASAMLRLAQDDQTRIWLATAGRDSVKDRFDIEQVAAQYEAIYARLAFHARAAAGLHQEKEYG
jgi:glycosyltransferase involved in cell wall biosynthesis